ncbi:coiled-coil domain-containing protein 30 [Lissotriton helveticus]
MMEQAKPENAWEDVLRALKETGLDPSTSAEECLCHLWHLYQRSEGKLSSINHDLHLLRQQQAEEMNDVQRYVDHIRMLTEERDLPTSDFEKEIEQLRSELQQLRLHYDAQVKEVEEMLDQEGLEEIAHSSPNEQIAYLLVERVTLLEKLEQAEEKLGLHFGSNREAQLKDELQMIHHTLEEQLQQRHAVHETKETLIQSPWKKLFGPYKDSTTAETAMQNEEFVKEKKLREFVERDLDEAAQRLQMAHAEIRRLTDELDMKKQEQETLESQELQKAKEHNNRLDKEILALRNRVRSLDSERKEYMELFEKLNLSINECQKEKREVLTQQADELGPPSASLLLQHARTESSTKTMVTRVTPEQSRPSDEAIHRQCQAQIVEWECKNNELLHKIQKIQREYDDLVERNEELESILGETQNQRKEEKENFECDVDGLERKILHLEAQLSQLRTGTEKPSTQNQEVAAERKKTSDFQQMFRSKEDSIEILESTLAAEREWRQQLELDLEAAQKALRDEKEMAHLSEESSASKHLTKDQNISHEFKNGISTPNRSPFKDLTVQRAALEERIEGLEKEKVELNLAVSESKHKFDSLQRQLYEGLAETEKFFNENVQLCHDLDNMRHELQSKKEETAQLRQQLTNAQSQIIKSTSSEVARESGGSVYQPEDSLRQQQQEEMRQMRQDVHRAQNLFIAAEKEMRHERDKNLSLQKNSNILQQENTKVKGELKHVQQKLADSSKLCASLEADLERSRQKVKELQVDQLKLQQTSKTQATLQEKLSLATSKASDAEKRILELEQLLKETQHQLCLTEARILRENRFEKESREHQENQNKLKRQLEEEQLSRKLSDQIVEELQQQIKSLRDRVTSLTQTNTELQVKGHQQESKLRIIDDNHKTTFSEHLDCQSNNQKLVEQLSLVRQEKEKLHMEYERSQKHLNEYIRKYHEKQLRHKAKLSRAKELHVQEIEQCHLHIKQLVSELALIRSQAEKEQAWIRKATTENDILLHEKRDLLVQMNDCEEMEKSNRWEIASLESRLHFTEAENRQLQESVLRLTAQVGALERMIKNIQTLNLEEMKSVVPSEGLLLAGTSLSFPNVSGSAAGLPDCIGNLKAIHDAKYEDTVNGLQTSLSLSPSQPSEMGYLNVNTPRTTAES